MHRLSRVNKGWSPDLAYAIGLITTDGNLSVDGRHINLTSKDEDMVVAFRECLGIDNKIGRKGRGGDSVDKKYSVIQFGDKNFYEFLSNIGLMPNKSKLLTSVKIPEIYFADFLRGCIDGDGSIGAYRHPESKYPQLRLRLCSASPRFLEWIKARIARQVGVSTGWVERGKGSVSVLIYAKADSIKILRFMYYPRHRRRLERKYLRAKPFLGE